MIESNKNLLLKDLSSRLPYGVKVYDIKSSINSSFMNLNHVNGIGEVFISYKLECRTAPIEDVKPYLFPLSSMTEEQKKQLQELYFDYIPDEIFNNTEFVYHYDCIHLIDWLNANHFDYRNLINKNLAIDCTNLNIY